VPSPRCAKPPLRRGRGSALRRFAWTSSTTTSSISIVLQENIVVLYRHTREPEPRVKISCSAGERDLDDRFVHQVARERALSLPDPSSVLHPPASERDLRVMDRFASWKDDLASFGLEVSTGPVVPFRAEQHLRSERLRGVLILALEPTAQRWIRISW